MLLIDRGESGFRLRELAGDVALDVIESNPIEARLRANACTVSIVAP